MDQILFIIASDYLNWGLIKHDWWDPLLMPYICHHTRCVGDNQYGPFSQIARDWDHVHKIKLLFCWSNSVVILHISPELSFFFVQFQNIVARLDHCFVRLIYNFKVLAYELKTRWVKWVFGPMPSRVGKLPLILTKELPAIVDMLPGDWSSAYSSSVFIRAICTSWERKCLPW